MLSFAHRGDFPACRRRDLCGGTGILRRVLHGVQEETEDGGRGGGETDRGEDGEPDRREGGRPIAGPWRRGSASRFRAPVFCVNHSTPLFPLDCRLFFTLPFSVSRQRSSPK